MDDPFERPFWKLLQTLGWIALRNRDTLSEMLRVTEVQPSGNRELPELPWDDRTTEAALSGDFWVSADPSEATERESMATPQPVSEPGFLRLDLFINWARIEAKKSGSAIPPVESCREAQKELLDQLACGQVRMLARLTAEEDRREVPADECADLEFWERGDKDRREYVAVSGVSARHRARTWHDVAFHRSEVLATWPNPAVQLAPAPSLGAELSAAGVSSVNSEAGRMRTGAPGRPSSMHFVEVEFERRVAQGEFLSKLAEEARDLHEWFQKKHPNWPSPRPKTIENRIRERYRRARTSPEIKP